MDVHDFTGEAGKATPHGVYDAPANVTWVSAGRDHDTATFPLTSLRTWCGRPRRADRSLYPKATPYTT